MSGVKKCARCDQNHVSSAGSEIEMRARVCVCVCVCGVQIRCLCQSPPDTLSCAVFSCDDRGKYLRHCCVLICTMDCDVAS